jgi:hypothetical protein
MTIIHHQMYHGRQATGTVAFRGRGDRDAPAGMQGRQHVLAVGDVAISSFVASVDSSPVTRRGFGSGSFPNSHPGTGAFLLSTEAGDGGVEHRPQDVCSAPVIHSQAAQHVRQDTIEPPEVVTTHALVSFANQRSGGAISSAPMSLSRKQNV